MSVGGAEGGLGTGKPGKIEVEPLEVDLNVNWEEIGGLGPVRRRPRAIWYGHGGLSWPGGWTGGAEPEGDGAAAADVPRAL